MATSAVPVSKSGIEKLIGITKKWGVRLIIIGLIGLVATKLIGSVSGGGDLFYQKTFAFERSDLQAFELCGIKPGTKKFAPAGPVRVKLWVIRPDGMTAINDHDIATNILVNDTIAGEAFEVNEKGCVKVSYDLPKNVRDHSRLIPQSIRLTFSSTW